MKFDRAELTKKQIADRVELVLRVGSSYGSSWVMMVLDGRQMTDDQIAEWLKEIRATERAK